MYFAYVDESGSSGYGSSLTFTLGCVLVQGRQWPDIFDNLIEYRRFLKSRFKVPVRAEIKANYLLHNGGPFRELALSESARHAVYRGLMRLQPKLGVSAFGIVIRKDQIGDKTLNPRDVAWEYLLQRLERFTTKNDVEVVLIHDEGEGDVARKLARKARRIGTAGSRFGTGYLRVPAKRIIDDPVGRKSHESYFLQLADLNAYAAFRHLYPPPPRAVQVVHQGMWQELGDARYAPVNSLAGGQPGLVAWP